MPSETKLREAILVPGEVTKNAMRDFLANLKYLSSGDTGPLILDCSAMNKVSSNHVGILWQAREFCFNANREVHLHYASRNLIRILEMLDLTDLFIIHPAEEKESTGNGVKRTPASPAQKHFRTEFELNIENINSTQLHFLEYLAGFGISDRITFELETVFYEIATNLRSHVGKKCGNSVKFMATCNSGIFIMRFIDSGPPFDPTLVPNDFNPGAVIMKRRMGGLGLMMVRRMTDKMNYERRNGRLNILTLEKKLDLSHG